VIWTPEVGEVLQVRTEAGNEHDDHAVAVIKDGLIVGHVPRSMSRVCWFFLWRGNEMSCRITDHRKFGNGLEVPCIYTFHSNSTKTIDKLKKILEPTDKDNS
jgi:hypothetical protein